MFRTKHAPDARSYETFQAHAIENLADLASSVLLSTSRMVLLLELLRSGMAPALIANTMLMQ